MQAFPAAKSPLGNHRILSKTAAIRVSPLSLGCMNFGDSPQHKAMFGECDKPTTFEILDYYYQNQGNFLDTANEYQGGQSEEWIGEWMESRKNRDEMVVATKYTAYRVPNRQDATITNNYGGNSTKSMHISLEASLKSLRTSYIDIFYLHWWDFSASVEEVMQSLNQLVQSGKVLYLGISDTPAYIVSKSNQYARDHGLRPFSIYQGRWSAIDRDFEREILRMCEDENMAIAPWGVLGGGHFKTRAQRAANSGARAAYRVHTPGQEQVIETLEVISERRGVPMTSVALAYVRHQSPYNVFPIVGGRSVQNLKENIAALEVRLTREEMESIEKAEGFEFGFPWNFYFMGVSNVSHRCSTDDIFLMKMNGNLDIRPHPATVPENGI